MPQDWSSPEPSRETHQAHEDAGGYWTNVGSRTLQHAQDNRKWKWAFKTPAIAKRNSMELEDGLQVSHEDPKVQRAGSHATGRLSVQTEVSQDTRSGILPAHFTSYHLPSTGGPLKIRNDPYDSKDDLGFEEARVHQAGHGSPFESSNEASNHQDYPMPGLTGHDDPAGQVQRAHKLLQTARRLAKTVREHMFYPIRERDDRSKTKRYVLNVATMQSAVIRYQQAMIMDYAAEIWNGGVDWKMAESLHKYCDALRDMDYMQEKARNGFDNDPFLLMTSKQMEREMMYNAGLISAEEMGSELPPAFDKSNPVLPGVGRTARFHATEAKARTINILCALLGGLALIIPMVIMTLLPSQTSVLVVTCSFVLVFALMIALLSGLRPNEVLAVTAGYAAVLVVFVGAQSGSGSSLVV